MQIMTRIIPEFLEIWTCLKLIVVLGRSPRPPPTIPLGGHFDFGSFTQINPLAVLARWSFGWFKWSRNEPQIFHIFITCIFIWISQRLLLEPSYSITPSFLTVTGCLADFANKKIKFFDNQKKIILVKMKNHFRKKCILPKKLRFRSFWQFFRQTVPWVLSSISNGWYKKRWLGLG